MAKITCTQKNHTIQQVATTKIANLLVEEGLIDYMSERDFITLQEEIASIITKSLIEAHFTGLPKRKS